ncbi:hypothetical protein [Campylobacter pinnipediorum]|uniref:hypothetical protein n=1 Tax=Campylobacter pinnipediorum TaxID=1965231 RepID=UPI00084DD7BF|nr:hypothetical protein [Campylobacter pinnipediorum]AQW80648.1 hypothetical protein CPIN17260_0311 [Campylobacter pinnipediorum subsp. pinnipediorum]OPA76580.1 hypothetical protein BFG05_05165 [Campylobacter pinnipediorum subsp. pinnipediorum]
MILLFDLLTNYFNKAKELKFYQDIKAELSKIVENQKELSETTNNLNNAAAIKGALKKILTMVKENLLVISDTGFTFPNFKEIDGKQVSLQLIKEGSESKIKIMLCEDELDTLNLDLKK